MKLFHVAVVAILACLSTASSRAQEAPQSAKDSTVVEPGYLGAITSDREEQGRGVRIMRVDRDSPADQAGLKEGDLIVKIGDRPIAVMEDLRSIMLKSSAGTKLMLHVDRRGSVKERELTLGQRPPREKRDLEFGRIPENLPQPESIEAAPSDGAVPADGNVLRPGPPPTPTPPGAPTVPPVPGEIETPIRHAPPHAYLGVKTLPVTERDRWQLGLPFRQGALVTAITVGSPADEIGLPLNAVIVALDGKPVTGPSELARQIGLMEPGKEVEVSFYERGELVRRRTVLAEGGEGPATSATAASRQRTDAAPGTSAPGTLAPSQEARIRALEQQIAELNQRLARLEEALKARGPAKD